MDQLLVFRDVSLVNTHMVASLCSVGYVQNRNPEYYPYPELVYVLYDIHARTRKFWMFCTTFIPVTGTCASSVRPWYKTRGAGTHLYNDPGAGYG